MNSILRGPLMLLSVLLVFSAAATAVTAVEDPVGLENLRKTAESGDAEAMLELGILYEFGFKMPDNKAPALAWYRLAGEAGNAKAVARQDGLRASMNAKEVEEANKLYAEYAAAARKPAAMSAAPPQSTDMPTMDTLPQSAPSSAPK